MNRQLSGRVTCNVVSFSLNNNNNNNNNNDNNNNNNNNNKSNNNITRVPAATNLLGAIIFGLPAMLFL